MHDQVPQSLRGACTLPLSFVAGAVALFTIIQDGEADLVHSASLKGGDYGAGALIDTMAPQHGGSPHNLGVVDSPQGVTYTATETDGRSNGLINYQLGAHRTSFLASGTIAVRIHAHSDTHASGAIFGDNYGYNAFRNGQGAFEIRANRVANGEGPDDDKVRISWNVLHPSPIAWHNVVASADAIDLDYARDYELGFTWGGPDHDFEVWVDGELAHGFDLPGGRNLPWGVGGSGTNLGIGGNHERGYSSYGSAPGITFSDLRIWDEYRELGDTSVPPQPGDPPFKQQLALHFDANKGTFSDSGATTPASIGETVNHWADLGPVNGDNPAVAGFYHGGGLWQAPVLGEAGIEDGLNGPSRTVRFNGGNGFVAELSGESAPHLNNQQVTVVSVVRFDEDSAPAVICGGRYGSLDSGWQGVFGMAWFTGWSSNGGYYGGARTPTETLLSVSGSDPRGIFVIQSYLNEGYGAAYWQSFLDSTNGIDTFQDAGEPVTESLRDLRADPSFPSPYFTALVIGRSDTSPGSYLNGDIAEILVYDGVLEPAARQEVVDHLWRKYFAVELPQLFIEDTDTGLELSWPAFGRYFYRVQQSVDRLASWETISGDLSGATGELIRFPIDSSNVPAFFRLEVRAPGGPPAE